MENIKKMVYGIAEGTDVLTRQHYKGIEFVVVNIMGFHPCGYICAEGTIVEGVSYKDKGYTALNFIDCHGGITYSQKGLQHIGDKSKWWIGWDYAHTGDYTSCAGMFYTRHSRSDTQCKEMRKYTTEEVIAECKRVIDQILNLENEEKVD